MNYCKQCGADATMELYCHQLERVLLIYSCSTCVEQLRDKCIGTVWKYHIIPQELELASLVPLD